MKVNELINKQIHMGHGQVVTNENEHLKILGALANSNETKMCNRNLN